MTVALGAADRLAPLAAIPVAALGGAGFLEGVQGVAARLRLPKMLVATTPAAVAASTPGMAVSSLAALAGKPEIGPGDTLGSHVVNLGLVLGLALLFGALAARSNELRRDFVVARVVPILNLLLALDGTLSRADGALLLSLFVLWSFQMLRQAIARRPGSKADNRPPVSALRAWVHLLVGLAALIRCGARHRAGQQAVQRHGCPRCRRHDSSHSSTAG